MLPGSIEQNNSYMASLTGDKNAKLWALGRRTGDEQKIMGYLQLGFSVLIMF